MSIFFCEGCQVLVDSDEDGYGRYKEQDFCHSCLDIETDCPHCRGVGVFGRERGDKCGWCNGTGKRLDDPDA